MGLIASLLELAFGSNRNLLRETAEVFRENSEAGAARGFETQMAALQSFQAEFTVGRAGRFDRFMDGVNRLPRPLMALGCLALLGAAMSDPVWFSDRMAGLALVPEPLWWLLGVIVSFYFGARHQAKGQAFQRDVMDTLAQRAEVVAALSGASENERPENSGPENDGSDTRDPVQGEVANPALEDWQARAAAK